MRLQTETSQNQHRFPLALVRDRIIEIIEESGGIKETDLTMIVLDTMAEIHGDQETSAVRILKIVQMIVQEGRVLAVDCQIGDTGNTFLFPAGTQIRVAVPVGDHRTTRH